MTDRAGKPMRRTPATPAVLIVLLMVAVGVGIWQDRDTELGVVAQVPLNRGELGDLPTAHEPGALAPNFRLPLASGGEIELASLRGRPVFINVWASWCFFCLTEMPAIQRVSGEYGDEVVILGVNVSDTQADIAIYAENIGIYYPLPMDMENAVREANGVRQMPTSIFIDEHGVVSRVVYGVIVPDQMREHIDAMLEDDPAASFPHHLAANSQRVGWQPKSADWRSSGLALAVTDHVGLTDD